MLDPAPQSDPNAPKVDVKTAIQAAMAHLRLVALQNIEGVQVEETLWGVNCKIRATSRTV